MDVEPDLMCAYPARCHHPLCACPVAGHAITVGCSSPTVVFLMIMRGQLESDAKYRPLVLQIDAEIGRLRRQS
jgi:hypothetical protein